MNSLSTKTLERRGKSHRALERIRQVTVDKRIPQAMKIKGDSHTSWATANYFHLI